MLIRANTLASGKCGVRYKLLERLIKMLNEGIHPIIPEQGSVGASGDLCPLAHMALVLIGRGRAKYKGNEYEGRELIGLLKEHDIDTDLEFKEGLALINGASVMTGIGVMAYYDAINLLKHADIAGALTLEGIAGQTRAFDEIVHIVRKFPNNGQWASAENILKIIRGSKLVNNICKVHDPYSVRCIPQVHGIAREALEFIKGILETEINSVTDDPIFFTKKELESYPPFDGIRDRLHFEQGNFHGQPISVALDLLGMILSSLGVISERRIQMLLDSNHNNGLDECLISNPDGIYSGLMLAQYTAAALASENKILAHPASVDSIPTGSNTEDHVSMGTIAARKARKILEHTEYILAIEMLCAIQALEYRNSELKSERIKSAEELKYEKLEKGKREKQRPIFGKPGDLSLKIYELIRKQVNPLKEDRELHLDIRKIRELIEKRTILEELKLLLN
jgi:histidine ammonia-lyase